MAGLNTGPSTKGLQVLFIPGVCLLIFFLGYTSQWLFYVAQLDPGPLTTRETYIFNGLLACLWWTYYKACTISPGEYTFSSSPKSKTSKEPTSPTVPSSQDDAHAPGARWCKKCVAPKPLRAHHCRHCARCIPKMDHHCPWTGNCVSLQTFPYFLRFLVWTNAGLWTLSYFLWQRAYAIWEQRSLPAYLGPSLGALIHLTMLGLCCAAVSLALGILLFTTAKGWVLNTTMIEGWEVERHEAVLARYSRDSWFQVSVSDTLADGTRFERVEFPYDIGFLANMAQAMGTANPLMWFFPLAGGPTVSPGGKGTGWDWPENGINPREGMWPPPDPEKLRRAAKSGWPGAAARQAQELSERAWGSPEEEKAAFRARQEQDLRRRQAQQSGIVAELEEMDDYDVVDEEEGYDDEDDFYEQGMDGEPGWTNSDGDRLRDYGVDEDAEDDDDIMPLQTADPEDDDVPLAELIRRRKTLTRAEED